MNWWKVALPVVFAGSGIAAVAVTRSDDSSAVPGRAAAWIDAPGDGTQLLAGTVTVQAHTNAGATTLTLVVDGLDVATDDQLEVSDGLAYATFDWDALAGVRTLVVRTADGATSVGSVVLVADASDAPPATAPTTTVPATTTPATTSTPTTTTTTLAPTTTRPAPTTAPPTTPKPTAPPTTPKPTVPKPAISSAALALDGNSCTARATAQVQGATSVSVRFSGPNVDETVAGGAGPSIDVSASSVSFSDGTYTATFTATGPGGVSVASANATIGNCKP